MLCPKCGYDLGEELIPARCPHCSENLSKFMSSSSKAYARQKVEQLSQAKDHQPKAKLQSHDVDEVNRFKRQKIAIILIGALFAVIAIFAFKSGLFTAPHLDNYVGMQVEYVKNQLKNKGIAVEEKEAYADQASNYVIAMDPPAGTPITKGMKVTLTISKQRIMPDLYGKTKDEATKILAEQGLKATFDTAPSDDKIDVVIKQNIVAGNPVTLSREIVLSIAAKRKVPDVTGKDIKEARKLVEEQGYRVQVVNSLMQTGQPGSILNVEPKAGSQLPKGSTVILTVAAEGKEGKLQDMVKDILNIVYSCDPDNPKDGIGVNLKPYLSPELSIGGVSAPYADPHQIWYSLIKQGRELPKRLPEEIEHCARRLDKINDIKRQGANSVECNITVTWFWDKLGQEYNGITSTDSRVVQITFDDNSKITGFFDNKTDIPEYTVQRTNG